MSIGDKLGQWQNKTESQKHNFAVVGATIFTVLVVIVWGYTFFNTISSDKKEAARNETYNKQFSPLAPIKNLFGENLQKIKLGAETMKKNATVLFTGTSVEPKN